MLSDLRGHVAVVSGGAGGIGSAISRRLAEVGCRVVVTAGSNLARAEELVAALPGDGHLAVLAPVDDPAAVADLAAVVSERHGRLDLLVNGAGVSRPVDHADLDGLDDELIDRIFRVNWRGAFAMVRAMHPLLSSGDGGVGVNLSSVAAGTGRGSNVAYAASKAALDSMTRSLARALAPNVRVLSVSPGVVLGEYAAKNMSADWIEEQLATTPLGRFAQPDDVADAVLAAVALQATTGALLPVDGGRPLGT